MWSAWLKLFCKLFILQLRQPTHQPHQIWVNHLPLRLTLQRRHLWENRLPLPLILLRHLPTSPTHTLHLHRSTLQLLHSTHRHLHNIHHPPLNTHQRLLHRQSTARVLRSTARARRNTLLALHNTLQALLSTVQPVQTSNHQSIARVLRSIAQAPRNTLRALLFNQALVRCILHLHQVLTVLATRKVLVSQVFLLQQKETHQTTHLRRQIIRQVHQTTLKETVRSLATVQVPQRTTVQEAKVQNTVQAALSIAQVVLTTVPVVLSIHLLALNIAQAVLSIAQVALTTVQAVHSTMVPVQMMTKEVQVREAQAIHHRVLLMTVKIRFSIIDNLCVIKKIKKYYKN